MDKIDVFTYSFPCQNISNASSTHKQQSGFKLGSKTKSSLVWEIGRVLKEISSTNIDYMPKSLLMENVSTILSKKFKPTFNLWLEEVHKLGYVSHVIKINSLHHGHPQNRRRVFCISYLNKRLDDLSIKHKNLKLIDKEKSHTHIYEYKKNHDQEIQPLDKFLKLTKRYESEALSSQPNDTLSRRKMYFAGKKLQWKEDKFDHDKYSNLSKNPNDKELINFLENDNIRWGQNQNYVNTITTRQDRFPNAGVINFKTEKNFFRFITPREAVLLMGFTNKDYEKLRRLELSKDSVYKLAGNSIVVPTMEIIMKYLVSNL